MVNTSEKQPIALGSGAPKKPSHPAHAFLSSFYRALLVVSTLMIAYHIYSLSLWKTTFTHSSTNVQKIALETHVIAKCSSAKSALIQLVYPAVQRIYDKVDFRLTFIATPHEDGTVECKHGDGECEGQIVELCAQDLYPDPRVSLGFIVCLYGDYARIPDRDLYETCAAETSVDFEAINHCATKDDGAYGLDLLRKSAQRSIDMDALISATIRLDGKKYCLRDNNEWSHCPSGTSVDDLVDSVYSLYYARNSGSGDGQLASIQYTE